MDNDGDALRLTIELSQEVTSTTASAWAATTAAASDQAGSVPWVWPGRLLAVATTVAAGASIGFGASYYHQHLSQPEEPKKRRNLQRKNHNDDGYADWRKIMDDARRINFFVTKSWTVHESKKYGAATKAMISMFPREFQRQATNRTEDAVGNIGRAGGEIADIGPDEEGNPQMARDPKDWTTIPDALALFVNLEENNLGYGDQRIGMRNNCYAHAALIAYRNVCKTIYMGREDEEDARLPSYGKMLKKAIHRGHGGDWGRPDHALKRLENEYDRGVMWVKLDDAEPTIQDVFCHEVILSFWTTAEGLTWAAAGDLTSQPPPGPKASGHAVYVESYDFSKGAYLCLNTWGSGKEGGNENHGRFWFKPEAAMHCRWLVVRRDLVQMEANETPMENVEKLFRRGDYYQDTDWYYVNRWYAKYNTSVMAFEVLSTFRGRTTDSNSEEEDEKKQEKDELAYLAIDIDEWVSAMKQLGQLLGVRDISEQDERRRARLLAELLYGEDSPWMKANQVVRKIWEGMPNHDDSSDSDYDDDERVGWVPGWQPVDPRGKIGRRMAGSTRPRSNEDGSRDDDMSTRMSEEELENFVIELAQKQIEEAKSAPVYPVENRKHLVIFVHGYKTPTMSVDERITEIDTNLGTDQVICVPFDWVSLNTYVRYHDDQDQVRQVLKYFIAYLKTFRDDGFFTQIDFVSHSMGNYLVDLAMNYKDEETGNPIGAEMFRGSNIVSCAADVAYKKFIKTVEDMEPIVNSWTHYFNPSDKALTVSPILNIRELDPRRAGTRALDEVKSDKVNSVKVVNYVGTDDWPRHGYVFDATCLEDIRALLIEGHMHPRERNDLTRSDDDKYWELSFPVVKGGGHWSNMFGFFGRGN